MPGYLLAKVVALLRGAPPKAFQGTENADRALAFMRALDVNEIHGYRPDLGLRVFTEEALVRHAAKHLPEAAE